MEKILKVGIVGCGGIANGKHLPALKKLENVKMVAFCDINIAKAEKAAKEFGVKGAKVYTDYKEVLKHKEIEAIYVLTPNKSHSFISIDAMKAGKHVMCEKPMAKTAVEAREMLKVSKETGKLLTIGYQYRHGAESRYLHKACQRGDLGEIYMAKAHALRRRAVPTWGVFLNEEEQGGGPLIDIGTHALDMALWMMDNYKVKSVKGNVYKKLGDQTETANAWGDWDPKEYTVEDSAFAFITMENGATIFLEASWALNTLDVGEAKVTLCGTKAGADMRDGLRINKVDLDKQITIKPELGAGGVAFFDGVSSTPADIEAKIFIDAITKETPLFVLPEQAIVVTEILEAVYESAKTGKTIEF
jgi:predicted dehydrogenase